MKQRLHQALTQALTQAQEQGDLPKVETPAFVVEAPKQSDHGDLASNLAMQLASACRANPRDIAQTLIEHLGQAQGLIAQAQVAGPGFINFFIQPRAWLETLDQIAEQGGDYGRGQWGQGQRVLVEFVSANPTGPLHVGHGRGAALGDVLCRLLAFSGHEVASEYYINDAGNQMATLGRSVLVRARQAAGSQEDFPDNHYQGDYIQQQAQDILASPEGAGLLKMPQDQAVDLAARLAGEQILAGIRQDLADFRVNLDHWFSESSLVGSGAVARALKALEDKGLIYQADGATWFKASALGDEKDRVVVRASGELTYFASDIAYHLDKFNRGYDQLIDVWGADHHGYVPRLKAAVAATGRPPQDLEVVLVQLVNLLRAGQPVAMSTRAGEFVTLAEVIDEVGADSARFIFLTRRADSPLDFDLEVAKAQSMDNPVFYVQYAHTRVKSVQRKAADSGLSLPQAHEADLGRLELGEEVALAKRLAEFPEVVAAAARLLEPHRLTYFLHELAGQFHSYYHRQHILVEDSSLAAARLMLAGAVGQVLAMGLGLLGVTAPEAM